LLVDLEEVLITAKRVADFLTVLRAFLGFSLVWIGVMEGAQGLSKAVMIMIADWTGDTIDGKIARRSKEYVHTWIGDHDLEVDMAVSCGLLVYMVTAGFVNIYVASGYVLFWTIIMWRWRNFKVFGMLSQAPIYGWFVWVAITRLPNVGIWILVWIVIAIILTWPQFPQQVIPGFFGSVREFMMSREKVGKD
jgi:hypothetical protein